LQNVKFQHNSNILQGIPPILQIFVIFAKFAKKKWKKKELRTIFQQFSKIVLNASFWLFSDKFCLVGLSQKICRIAGSPIRLFNFAGISQSAVEAF